MNVNQNGKIVEEYKNLFESLISAGRIKQVLGCEKSSAEVLAWSCDMEGHAKKCVARYCGLANCKFEQLCQVSAPTVDDRQFKKEEELETVGELSKVGSHVVLKMLKFTAHRQA